MKALIVLPALNEEDVLERSVLAVRDRIAGSFPGDEVRVLVVDNGSDDATGTIATRLSEIYPGVGYLRLETRGKGLAVRRGWESEPADMFMFMDADLATDLDALPALLDAVRDGADIAVGSRYHAESVVSRSLFRRLMSKGYRGWLGILFRTGFADAPCGFKAVSPAVVREILPQVQDDGWFFDSELLVRAERAGFHVHEVPVKWSDARDRARPSKVAAFRLAVEYMQKTLRLRRELGHDRE